MAFTSKTKTFNYMEMENVYALNMTEKESGNVCVFGMSEMERNKEKKTHIQCKENEPKCVKMSLNMRE